MTGITARAGTCQYQRNSGPGTRVGQPEERLTTVTLYIAAGRRFFQFEMAVAINGVTKRTAANSGPVSPQPVNTGA